jgi:hypothetical protein
MVMTQLRYYPSICLVALSKPWRTSIRIAAVLTEIQTEHLMNTSSDCYHYSNPISFNNFLFVCSGSNEWSTKHMHSYTNYIPTIPACSGLLIHINLVSSAWNIKMLGLCENKVSKGRVLSSWMWHHVVQYTFADVSGECAVSIFRAEE